MYIQLHPKIDAVRMNDAREKGQFQLYSDASFQLFHFVQENVDS